jgi:predicted nucleotide-binding protein
VRPAVAINALARLKSEASGIDVLYHDPGAAESWKSRVRSVITRSLGDSHYLVGKLDRNSYELGVWTGTTTDLENQKAFADGIRRACGFIDAAIFELGIDDEERLEVKDDEVTTASDTAANPERARKVFVVHGRNESARKAMFEFLRALGLSPIEWSKAVKMTGEASPYIGRVLDVALREAQAIVVMLTPDDIAYLRSEYATGKDDPEIEPLGQARPNVLFEAGMAMGHAPDRTVLVEFGKSRPFSDVAGRHALRMDASPRRRKELAERLQTAKCAVNMAGDDWLETGDLTPPQPPGSGLPLGRRLPGSGKASGVRLDARFHSRSNGGRLEIINNGPEPVYDLDVEFPEELQGFRVVDPGFPVPKLPGGKSLMLVCSLTMSRNTSYFNLVMTGHTAAGDAVREEAFVDLAG